MQNYGFERPDFVSKEVYEDFRKSYQVVLERRCARWKTVIDQGNLVRDYQLKRFCRKGIPAQFRSHVWMTLSGAYETMQQNPKVYQTAAAAQPPKTTLTTIMADIPRTFPENVHFSQAQGKGDKLQALQRILTAFAIAFPKIGYCQGLNYVAATLLLAMQGVPEAEAEERAFWLLHALSHHIVPKYYSDSMVDVRVDCLVFEELLKKKAPSIYKTLKNAHVDCVVLATKWFICLFADVLPIETVLRIFDSLFYEGNKILFRACIALAKLHTREILYDSLFPDDKQTLYCHEFLKAMFTLPGSLSRSLIRKLRGKCLQTVKVTLSELEAQERNYRERMALQNQQQQKEAQQKDEEQPTNDSYSEEVDDSDNVNEMLKPSRHTDHVESSPSLNAPASHGSL
ncbi:growth hormone regulated TBC protein 1 A [Echinococcus multilocularis]|uniref:Growth hormone regulated TBC protein 1 A n=1 Tax=Echinococcus multilocularis TaxID=6211 RepID=A0A068XUJ8_ECHMU|nr:growth hormone regulated TBC protein 1 A [Echinococcus multilocularis]